MSALNSIYEKLILRDGEQSILRNFDQQDLDRVVAVEKDASRAPWSLKNFADSIASSHICVAITYQENWLAHAVFSIAAGEAELLIITVNKNFRRKGIATLFLETMESKLSKSAREMFLEVRASNLGAIDLYEALGFNCIGERRNYYPAIESEGGSRSDKQITHSTKRTPQQREDALIYGKHFIPI